MPLRAVYLAPCRAVLCSQVKFDDVENLGTFVQILGKDRARVAQVGKALSLDGTYIARSYIEQVRFFGFYFGWGRGRLSVSVGLAE